MRMRALRFSLYLNAAILAAIFGFQSSVSIAGDRTVEKTAVPSLGHPYAGFWKEPNCLDRFGIAIAPADDKLYSLSFCGPGGCFEPGEYRPNSAIVDDPLYKIVDANTIMIKGQDGTFAKYVRCQSRQSTLPAAFPDNH